MFLSGSSVHPVHALASHCDRSDTYGHDLVSARRAVAVVISIFVIFTNCAAAQNRAPNRASVEDELRRAGALRNQALEKYQQNNVEAALPLMEQSVSIASRALGAQHVTMADLQSDLGHLYRAAGNYRASRSAFEQVLAIRKKAQGLENADSIKAMNDLATLLGMMGEYAEAKSLFEQAVASSRKALGAEHPDTAASINNLGGLLEDMGDYTGAKRNYEQALAVARKVFGNEHINTASAINNLSVISQKLEDYPSALKFSLESLAIRKKVLGPKAPEVALSLDNLSVIYAELNQFSNAKSSGQQAVDLFRETLGNEHPETATAITNFGGLLKSMGDTAAARSLFEEALQIRKNVLGMEHPSTAASLDQLAALLDQSGDFHAARPLYEQSLAIRRKALGDEHPITAESWIHVGHFLETIGDHSAAQSHFERALAANQKAFGPDHTAIADTLDSLARVLHDRGVMDRAKALYQQALSIRIKAFGPEHMAVSSAYNNLGLLQGDIGEYQEALENLQKCLSIRIKLLGEDHPALAVVYNNLGIVYSAMGDPQSSITQYEQAIRICRKSFGDNNPKTASSLANLGIVVASTDDRSRAADLFDESRKITANYLARFLPCLSQREQMQYLAGKQASEFSMVISFAVAAGDTPAIVNRSAEWVINNKGTAHEVLARSSIQSRTTTDTQQIAAREELLLIRSQMASLLTRNADENSADIQRSLEDLSVQEEALARRLQNTGRDTSDTRHWQTLDELRSKLSGDSVLIEYVKYTPFTQVANGNSNPDRYAAWIIPPAGRDEVRLIDLGDAQAIDEAVSGVRAKVAPSDPASELAKTDEVDAVAELTKLTLSLTSKVLEPLKLDDTCEELIISPDSDLWLLPWNSLAINESGKFLVENYKVRFLISTRNLLSEDKKQSFDGVPAIFANPQFNLPPASVWESIRAVFRKQSPSEKDRTRSTDFSQGLSRFSNVQPLPGTAIEAALIAPNLEKYSHSTPITYVGKYALESVAKAMKNPSVVLFATHGFFRNKRAADPHPSRLSAGSELPSATSVSLQPLENPLLNCGLLLAGCSAPDAGIGTAGDDGVLTGLEIAGINLHETHLVVLSACETGLGEVNNGEGVAGLRQSFQMAGARSVISTLWSVPDRESALLVSDLFAALADGKSVSESLRNAQLERIATRRERFGAAHPFYWAAFTLTGN
ncbi:MAG: CHAT domain-containing protein [Planctomycetaceae bacterium]|nr:CHAT domain-containing protein [Planctomycetaceae bacterium]